MNNVYYIMTNERNELMCVERVELEERWAVMLPFSHTHSNMVHHYVAAKDESEARILVTNVV